MNATFRPTLTNLDDRLLPAAGLFAALPAANEADDVRHAEAAHTEDVWVGQRIGAAASFTWLGDVADTPAAFSPVPVGGLWNSIKDATNKTINVIGDAGKKVADLVVDGGKAVVDAGGKVIDAIADGAKKVFNPDPLEHFRSRHIDLSTLRPGDVILEASSGWKAKAIGFGTHSDYTHAAIYIGDGKIVEAVGDGVRIRNLKDLLNDAGVDHVMVVRVPGMTDADRKGVVDFAKAQVGKAYNTAGAMRLVYPETVVVPGVPYAIDRREQGGTPYRNDYYCSQLVTAALKVVGRELHPSLERSPGELADHAAAGKMEVIGCVYDASHHRSQR